MVVVEEVVLPVVEAALPAVLRQPLSAALFAHARLLPPARAWSAPEDYAPAASFRVAAPCQAVILAVETDVVDLLLQAQQLVP